jgi:hypothetical protein
MKTQKIVSAIAITLALGAAAPAFADGNSGRFPGIEVEKLTMELQEQHAGTHTATSASDYTDVRFPGLAVERLTEELEDMQIESDAEPVTIDAPTYG